MLALAQGTTLHRRRTTDHVEYEDNIQWSHAFVLTFEIMSCMDNCLKFLTTNPVRHNKHFTLGRPN